MTMLIRTLDPIRDHARVLAFLRTAADYIRLERDAEPSPDVADEFFTDTPPGCDPAQSLHLGMLQSGRLIAIAEMSMGFPDAQTAYVGLLVLAPQARGRGLGRDMLRYLESRAREKHVSAIVSVFWTPTPAPAPSGGVKGFTPPGIAAPSPLVRRRRSATACASPCDFLFAQIRSLSGNARHPAKPFSDSSATSPGPGGGASVKSQLNTGAR